MIKKCMVSTVIVVIVFINTSKCLECFRSPFPKVLGGSLNDTIFNALDIYLKNGDIVAVGHTFDMGVKGGSLATNESPLIVFYSGVSLTMAWGRVLDVGSYSFNGVVFSADG